MRYLPVFLALSAIVATPALAQDLPTRKPGLWEMKMVYEGRNLRFDIDSKEAGYLWIRQPDGSGEYRVAPWPGRVLLAVMPNP